MAGSGGQSGCFTPSSGNNRIRRCFMTGKQCIFCGSENTQKNEKPSVFVAMPYRPNLAMCYAWSLKPFLENKLKRIWGREVDVKRADEYAHIGAITCEKICRPIQDASLVVVDVSIPNENVMYELGLALGLEKDILLIHSQQPQDSGFAEALFNYLKPVGTPGQGKLLMYPGVGFIKGEDIKIKDHILRLPPATRAVNSIKLMGLAEDVALSTEENDVQLNFASILDGAMEVAINSIIERKRGDAENLRKKIADAKDHDQEEERGLERQLEGLEKEIVKIGKYEGLRNSNNIDPQSHKYVAVHGQGQNYNSFVAVREELNNTFCCIVDLADETPLAYLWLGYCHSRCINVIPIHRPVWDVERRIPPPILYRPCPRPIEMNEQNRHGQNVQRPNVLAFDIRALWYINYTNDKAERLAELLCSVFSELINRDLPRLERNRFWGRLTTKREVSIFTGAVHIDNLKREMVGDWDQRTVSELVRYLSSTDETVTPVLEPPIYSPEYCWLASNKGSKALAPDRQFYTDYVNRVDNTLRGKNCIIVASADVNALTEILLSKAYFPDGDADDMFCDLNDCPEDMVIAIKPDSGQKTGEGGVKKKTPGKRVFSRVARDGEPLEFAGNEYRGFKIGKKGKSGNNLLLRTRYYAQEARIPPDGFCLLSHILIMRNPFTEENSQGPAPLVVILNGVSGPGTYALAEVLTGGNDASEEMLVTLNERLDEMAANKNGGGVQGIVQVTISNPAREVDGVPDAPVVALYDQRTVSDWKWCEANPRHNNKDSGDWTVVQREKNPWLF